MIIVDTFQFFMLTFIILVQENERDETSLFIIIIRISLQDQED